MISKKFIKTSFIYTVAGSLPMASAILLLPFYVSQLPTNVYGALSLYLAFSLFIQIVVMYSFESSTYIHYHEYKRDFKKLSSFISSAFIFMLLIGAGVGLVLVLFGDLVFDLIFDDEKISFYPFGLLSVATGIFQALFKVYCNFLQTSEKPILFLRSNILLFALIAGLTIGGLYLFPATLIGPIGGRMVAGLVVACWVLYRVFIQFGFQFNYPLLKSTFTFNHYSFISQIQQWVINYFDRFLMLFFLLPLSSIGIYDFALKCLVVIEFIMGGLHSSFFPKVVGTITDQSVKSTTPELNRYYHGLTAVIMLMISASIFVLPLVINFFDTKGYSEAIQYFPYIAVLYVLKTMRFYFAVPYGILKYTKPLPVYYFIIAVIKIGLMALLIRRFEIYGVVAATLVAAAGEILLLKYGLRGRFNFKFNVQKLVLAPVLLLVTVLLLEPLFAKDFALELHAFYLVLTVFFLVWIYRNELKLFNFTKTFSSK